MYRPGCQISNRRGCLQSGESFMIVSELTQLSPMDHYTMLLAAPENLLIEGDLNVACGKQIISYSELSLMRAQKHHPRLAFRVAVVRA